MFIDSEMSCFTGKPAFNCRNCRSVYNTIICYVVICMLVCDVLHYHAECYLISPVMFEKYTSAYRRDNLIG